jgi:hypothetical protein
MDKYYFSANQVLRKGNPDFGKRGKRKDLYETLSVILIALWCVALGTGYTLHGFSHLLLVGAIGAALVQFTQGRHGPK